jgi:hypothetical protein
MISDLKVLEKACDSKKMKDSELKFDVIDPPRSVIVSSDDDKLTVNGVTNFLTKEKLETLTVRTTEEGSISVKFKSPEGMGFIIAFHFFLLFFFTKGPGELLPSHGIRRLLSVVCKLFTFQASSPKPLGQLEPNLAGMFLGWSSIKFLFFVPVGYSTWLPGPIICSDWLKFQRSSSLKLMN